MSNEFTNILNKLRDSEKKDPKRLESRLENVLDSIFNVRETLSENVFIERLSSFVNCIVDSYNEKIDLDYNTLAYKLENEFQRTHESSYAKSAINLYYLQDNYVAIKGVVLMMKMQNQPQPTLESTEYGCSKIAQIIDHVYNKKTPEKVTKKKIKIKHKL